MTPGSNRVDSLTVARLLTGSWTELIDLIIADSHLGAISTRQTFVFHFSVMPRWRGRWGEGTREGWGTREGSDHLEPSTIHLRRRSGSHTDLTTGKGQSGRHEKPNSCSGRQLRHTKQRAGVGRSGHLSGERDSCQSNQALISYH